MLCYLVIRILWPSRDRKAQMPEHIFQTHDYAEEWMEKHKWNANDEEIVLIKIM